MLFLFLVLVVVLVLVLDSTAARPWRRRETTSEPRSWAFRGEASRAKGGGTPGQVGFLLEGQIEDEDDDEDEDD